MRFFVLTVDEALAAWKKPTTVGDIGWNRLPEGCEGAFWKIDPSVHQRPVVATRNDGMVCAPTGSPNATSRRSA